MAESNQEDFLLAFKESGVEFVEDAAKAVGELGDKMQDVQQIVDSANAVLKDQSTVIDDLREKIEAQKKRSRNLPMLT